MSTSSTSIVSADSDDGSMGPWLDRWFEPWAQACQAGLLHGRGAGPVWHPQERLAGLRHDSSSHATVVVAAVEGHGSAAGRVLGGARVLLPRRDNPSLAMVELAVHPSHRRAGVGTALLERVRAEAAERGRTSLWTEVDVPLERADGWPGAEFARGAGLTMRLGEVCRELRLPVPSAVASRLHEEAQNRGAGYDLRSWEGFTAPADLELLAALSARLSTDAPQGELEYEPEVWDAGRVRDDEERSAAQGIRWWTVLAQARDGEPVGFTQLGVSRWQPERLWQWATLVLTGHRGHRLGLAMKLRCLREAVAAEPAARVVTTWNAASNTPMIAVNDAMGFRPVEVCQEWQGPV